MFARPEKARLDRAHGTAGNFRQLLVTEVAFGHQQDQLTLARRQLRQDFAETLHRCFGSRCDHNVFMLGFEWNEKPPETQAAQMIETYIAGNLEQPRLKGAAVFKARETNDHLDERFVA